MYALNSGGRSSGAPSAAPRAAPSSLVVMRPHRGGREQTTPGRVCHGAGARAPARVGRGRGARASYRVGAHLVSDLLRLSAPTFVRLRGSAAGGLAESSTARLSSSPMRARPRGPCRALVPDLGTATEPTRKYARTEGGRDECFSAGARGFRAAQGADQALRSRRDGWHRARARRAGSPARPPRDRLRSFAREARP